MTRIGARIHGPCSRIFVGSIVGDALRQAIENRCPDALAAAAEITESEQTTAEQAGELQVVELETLVRMKLTSYRDKDRRNLANDCKFCSLIPTAKRCISFLANPQQPKPLPPLYQLAASPLQTWCHGQVLRYLCRWIPLGV